MSFIAEIRRKAPVLLRPITKKTLSDCYNTATQGIAHSCRLKMQLEAIKAGWIHFHPVRLAVAVFYHSLKWAHVMPLPQL